MHIKPKALLFCHDASGLGHLRRMSRVAAALRVEFACAIITGIEEGHWMIQDPCQLFKIPNWDRLTESRAKQNGREMWLNLGTADAALFKSRLISAVGTAFGPDAILVDYLPFGLHDELRDFLTTTTAIKYLIHRGVIDTADRIVLAGDATKSLGRVYDRILVMADERLIDVGQEYNFAPEARVKTTYAGFVDPFDDVSLPAGLTSNPRLVVCACGGGRNGSLVFDACIDAARHLPECEFHVVLGPYGTANVRPCSVPSNCKVREVCDLQELHQQACVVITHGGYNSIMEAIGGGARILVCHIQGGDNDERIVFERRMSAAYPIRSISIPDLWKEIRREILDAQHLPRPSFLWRMDGLSTIRRLLKNDLGFGRETKEGPQANRRSMS